VVGKSGWNDKDGKSGKGGKNDVNCEIRPAYKVNGKVIELWCEWFYLWFYSLYIYLSIIVTPGFLLQLIQLFIGLFYEAFCQVKPDYYVSVCIGRITTYPCFISTYK